MLVSRSGFHVYHLHPLFRRLLQGIITINKLTYERYYVFACKLHIKSNALIQLRLINESF